MANYAIVNSDNIVENIIVWDGENEYSPPKNTTLIQSETAKIGDTWDGVSFITPEQDDLETTES